MAISDKLEYLNATKQLLKDKINNLGGSIDDNTTFRQYANQLQNVYNNLPKTEYQEGTSITLENCLKGKLDYENGVVGIGQTEQDGTPTPSTPITINSVTGNQDVVVSGKNLWEFGNYMGNATKMLDFTNPLPKGTYTFSFNTINAAAKAMDFYSSDKTRIKNLYIAPHTTITKVTSTFTADIEIAKVKIYSGDSADELTEIQLEQGSSATTYEPYITPTSYQLSLGDIELCGIGDYRDYIYKNNGKWYKKGVITKHIFSNDDSFSKQYTSSSRTGFSFNAVGSVPYTNANSIPLALSTKFRPVTMNDTWVYGCFSAVTYSASQHSLYFFLQANKEVEDIKSVLTGTPLYYVLETPTDTEITDETLISQLNAWYNAHSNNGTIIITSNGNLPMVIKVRGLKGE